MSTVAIPLREIKLQSKKNTDLWNNRHSFISKIKIFVRFPWFLCKVNDALSGERLGELDSQQAASLRKHLAPLYDALKELESDYHSRASLPVRIFAGWWFRRIEAQTERLSDILETLSWGSDDELRCVVDNAVERIESGVHNHLCPVK